MARKGPVFRSSRYFTSEESGVFSEGSGFVRPLTPLRIKADAVFRKRRHSALVGWGLDVWLIENHIRRVIVSGIRTEQCWETTTRARLRPRL